MKSQRKETIKVLIKRIKEKLTFLEEYVDTFEVEE